MKYSLIKIIKLLLVTVLLLSVSGCKGCKSSEASEPVTDPEAEDKKDENRYFTIINNTESSVINKVEIYVGDGILVVEGDNPDTKSYSYKISEVWKDYNTFTIVLVDVYGLRFEKVVNDVAEIGKLDISITEDDYVKQPGDTKRKIERFLNE